MKKIILILAAVSLSASMFAQDKPIDIKHKQITLSGNYTTTKDSGVGNYATEFNFLIGGSDIKVGVEIRTEKDFKAFSVGVLADGGYNLSPDFRVGLLAGFGIYAVNDQPPSITPLYVEYGGYISYKLGNEWKTGTFLKRIALTQSGPPTLGVMFTKAF